MSFPRERKILKATEALASDFRVTVPVPNKIEEEDPQEAKREFVENVESLVDTLREKFQADAEQSEVNSRVNRLLRKDAEKEIFVPLERACIALASYYQAEYETDFQQPYSLTDGDLVLILIRRLRALRFSADVVSRVSKKSLESTKIAKEYASIFVQTLNSSLRVNSNTFSLLRMSEFTSLPESEFFALMLEVARVMAGGEIDSSTEEESKNIRFFIHSIAASIVSTQEAIPEIKNDRFTNEDVEELGTFVKTGNKFAARLKVLLAGIYQISLKPKLSPQQEERLLSFASLLFNMHHSDALHLNSQNLLLLGIHRYGDLWKVLRILQRAQELQPDLTQYSLEAISQDILENIDNEDILRTELSIIDALQAHPTEAVTSEISTNNETAILEELRTLFYQSKSQLEFSDEKLDSFDVISRYGIQRITTHKDGHTLQVTVDFNSTSINIFIYTKTQTMDWDRLYPLSIAPAEEQLVLLQILQVLKQLMQEAVIKKASIKLDKPTHPAVKGPKRDKDQATALEFSTPLTPTNNQDIAIKDVVKQLQIKINNLADIDVFFPKRMPEFAKRIIKVKLRNPNPKFLKKLDYQLDGRLAYRYKVQSFRIILVNADNSAENTFELEVYAIGDRKEIYQTLAD